MTVDPPDRLVAASSPSLITNPFNSPNHPDPSRRPLLAHRKTPHLITFQMSDSTARTAPPTATTTNATAPVTLPRITIQFCTQCKWNLRAAYFAQELLSTFSTSLGEVALLPSTGGTFVIKVYHASPLEDIAEGYIEGRLRGPKTGSVIESIIWDRKVDGGFPETKELKNRVRNVIEPGRSLGHTDRALGHGRGNSVDLSNGSAGERRGSVRSEAVGGCAECGR